MSERIYSDKCPVHQTVLKTNRTKKFCLERSWPIYDEPIFFCDKCQNYYVFIKELNSDFIVRAKENDGYPIKIIGRKQVNKPNKIIEKSFVSAVKKANAVVNPKTTEIKKSVNKNKEIYRKEEDGLLIISITPLGIKMPKICPKCGKTTSNLKYRVTDHTGKKKLLIGKECTNCGSIYYTEPVARQHMEKFIIPGFVSTTKKSEQTDHKVHEEKCKVEGTAERRAANQVRSENELDKCGIKDKLSAQSVVKPAAKMKETFASSDINDDEKLLADECPEPKNSTLQRDIRGIHETNDNQHSVEAKNIDATDKIYTDDFGIEFDFSELAHMLDLK